MCKYFLDMQIYGFPFQVFGVLGSLVFETPRKDPLWKADVSRTNVMVNSISPFLFRIIITRICVEIKSQVLNTQNIMAGCE